MHAFIMHSILQKSNNVVEPAVESGFF